MAQRVSIMHPRLIGRSELIWRARAFARTQAERVAARVRVPRWNRETLHNVLAPGVLQSTERRAIDAGEWTAVHNALLNRFQKRPSRFALDHHAAEPLAARISARWPEAVKEAANRGDRLLDGRYDLLAYHDLSFADNGQRTNWHWDPVHDKRAPIMFWADVPYLDPDVVGDHKIIWELNRHQYWQQLGRALWLTRDPKYGDRIVEDLCGWLAANPPLQGINWASMLELAFRSISWTWGLHFLLGVLDEIENSEFRIRNSQLRVGPEPWLVDMLVALDRQLRHVEHNLSYYFSPNTHLTGEALALYTVGLALPELAASVRWVDRGRAILLQEIDRQILTDGGHVERSAHYHRYTLDIYLFALVMAKRANRGEPVAAFTDAVARLATFARALADDRGSLPVIGDDDGGMLWPITGRDCRDVRDSLALAAAILERPQLSPWGLQEEVCWIGFSTCWSRLQPALVRLKADATTGCETGQSAPSSTFPDTGYVIMRNSAGDHLAFDVGPHGYLNGGHAHADALAIALGTAHGPLLLDPGTSTYTLDPQLRDRMRRSRNHNTVEIDGHPQSIPAGPFHWRTRTDSRLHAQRHNPRLDWAEASHPGYKGTQHRRSVVRSSASGWLIADEVLADGRHSAAAFWHFDPEWTVTAEAPGRLRATHRSGAVRWLLHDGAATRLVHGDERSGLGWCAPVYGALVPTWSAAVTQEGQTPFTLITWISGSGSVMPSLERLAPTCDPFGRAVAARIVDGERASLFLVRAGEPRVREGRATGVAEYQTDARVLHCVSRHGRFVSLDLIDASHALALSDGLLSVSADGVIGDLHVELHDDVLELCSSEPPPRLTLQGDAVGELVITSWYSPCTATGSEYSAAVDRTHLTRTHLT